MARSKNFGTIPADIGIALADDLSEAQLEVLDADNVYLDYSGDFWSIVTRAQALFSDTELVDPYNEDATTTETAGLVIHCVDDESTYDLVILQSYDEQGADILFVSDSRPA